MRAGKCFKYLAIILTFSILGVSSQAYADEEALGRKAEQAGKLRQALGHYVSALQSASEGSSTEQHLREKIIRLAPKIQPPPAVPEEAERYMARGRAAVKAAEDEQGFMRAAKEFRKGLNVAPWLVDGYYNLGVVLDKAGKYDEAIENLKLYLVAIPDAKDAKNLIYEIDYRKEEAERVKLSKAERSVSIDDFTGKWECVLVKGESTRLMDLVAEGGKVKYYWTFGQGKPQKWDKVKNKWVEYEASWRGPFYYTYKIENNTLIMSKYEDTGCGNRINEYRITLENKLRAKCVRSYTVGVVYNYRDCNQSVSTEEWYRP